jgi:hypothetical protein
MKIAWRFFENVAGFKYLATTLAHENCIHVERKLNSGNA